MALLHYDVVHECWNDPTFHTIKCTAAEESVLWSTRNFEDGIASTNIFINDNDNDEFSEGVSDERQVLKI